jgi:predicted acetyltransferase
MTEVRIPADDEREQIVDVLEVSLNLNRAFREERAAWLPLEKMRCVVDDGRVIGTAGARDLRQWFGGREIETSGIWGVATLPEDRGAGVATLAVSELLHDARAKGQPLSTLYPATLRPYRALGYELAGTMTRHELAMDDIPHGPSGPLEVRELDLERDLDDVRACYRSSVEDQEGPIDSDDPDWWPRRILGRWFSDDRVRAIVARGTHGDVEAYASFAQVRTDGRLEVMFRIDAKHLVASTLEGWASILSYLRGFRGLGSTIRFAGPPAHPLAMLIEEQRVTPVWSYRWMLRLLDVPAALEQRGYQPISGEITIAVEDGLFPDNRGPWRVVAKDGSVTVEPAATPHVRPIPIGTLSSMFTGFLSPFDAARLGLIDRDDAPFLASLFAGRDPWMHDFF